MMLQTDSSFDERFGYIQRGKFRYAFSFETFLVITAFAAAIGLFVPVNIFLIKPIMQTTSAAAALAGITAIIPYGIIVFLFIFAYSVIMHGKEGSYYADKIKFVVKCGSRKDIFYYKDVIIVKFSELFFLDMPRGYKIEVITRDDKFTYTCLSPKKDGYSGIEETPFYILKYNAEKDTTPQHTKISANAEPYRPEAPQVYTRALADAENDTSRSKPAYKPIKEEDIPIAKGSFRTPYAREFVILCMIAVAFVVGEAIVINLIDSIMFFYSFDLPMVLPLGIFGIVWALVLATLFKFFLGGKQLPYVTTSRELRISNGKNTSVIYITDVLSVEYSPYRMLWVMRGYRVKLTTKYKTEKYIFLFPNRKKHTPTSDTPFGIVERLIGQDSGDNKR